MCKAKAQSSVSERHATAFEVAASTLADLVEYVTSQTNGMYSPVPSTAILGDLAPQRAAGFVLSAKRTLVRGIEELLENAEVVRVSPCPECMRPQNRHCWGCGTCLTAPRVHHRDDCEAM